MWKWLGILGFSALLLPQASLAESNFREPNLGRNNLQQNSGAESEYSGQRRYTGNPPFYSAPTVFRVEPNYRAANSNPGPTKTGSENYRNLNLNPNAKRSVPNDNYRSNEFIPHWKRKQNLATNNVAQDKNNKYGNNGIKTATNSETEFSKSETDNANTRETTSGIDAKYQAPYYNWNAERLRPPRRYKYYGTGTNNLNLKLPIPEASQQNKFQTKSPILTDSQSNYDASQYSGNIPVVRSIEPESRYRDDSINEVQGNMYTEPDNDNSQSKIPEDPQVAAENDDTLPEDFSTSTSEIPTETTLPDLTRQTRQDDDFRDEMGGNNMGELPGSSGDGDSGEPEESYVEWCEGTKRKRVKQSQCDEITFAAPFPSCYCIEGMASVRLDQTKNCDTMFHFSKAGCYEFEALGHGTRSIRLEQNFKPSDFVVAVEIINDGTSEWSIMGINDLHDGSLVQIQRNVVVLNGELFQSETGNCIQKLNCKVIRTYRNVYGPYQVSFDRCPGFAISDSRLVSKRSIVDTENQQCTPSCKCKDKATSLAERNSGSGGQNGQNVELELPSLEPFCKPIPPILRSLHDDLNSRILRRSIDRAFEAHAELPDLKPQRTFNVLAKLAEITHRVCKNGDVPRRFLDTAVDVFKVAHEGRGFYFHEDLSPRDYKFIMKALEHCLDDVDPLEFYQTDCDGAITDVKNETKREPIKLSNDHEYFDHHLVLDISWNMVDLVNVACVDAFKHSYRMYHEMEQSLEKLFTRELRSLWQYPDYPRNFYDRLFGIFWENTARNLEMCVEGSYLATNKKMWRLNRPTWIEGGGVGGTRGDKICKRRLTNEADKLLSTSYEIYCNSLNCA